MTGQPTAAEVLAAHPVFWLGDYPGGTRCDSCGVLDVSTTQHQADMLAAAGLLVTLGPEVADAGMLLRLLAQETFRIHFPDDGSSPWADEWRDEDMQAAADRLVASYESKVEPYRGVVSAWLAEHDAQVAAKVLRGAARAFRCDNETLSLRDVALVNANAVHWLKARADLIEHGEAT